ncbi:unnamed protein product [Mytilus coruscus]|uniref:Uncharacterized protein n=1 Tax=Mytilus coruscus TaxID=42192 RepID=A0A6J8D9C3_MYTCO|nr:unnamed protein product [Mytilus coruscus]
MTSDWKYFFTTDKEKDLFSVFIAGSVLSYVAMAFNIIVIAILARKNMTCPIAVLMQGLGLANFLTACCSYGLEPLFQAKYIILSTFCSVVMVMSTIFIVYKRVLSSASRGQMSKYRRRERKSMLMVVIILLVFLVTEIPKVGVYFWFCVTYLKGDFVDRFDNNIHAFVSGLLATRFEYAVAWIMSHYTDILEGTNFQRSLVLNFALESVKIFTVLGCLSNFVVYIIMSSKIRNEIKHTMRKPSLRSNQLIANTKIISLLSIAGTKIIPLLSIPGTKIIPLLSIAGTKIIPLFGIASTKIIPILGIASTKIIPLLSIVSTKIIPLLSIAGIKIIPLLGIASTTIIPLLSIAGTKIIPLLSIAGIKIIPLLGIASTKIIPLLSIASTKIIPLLSIAGIKIIPLLSIQVHLRTELALNTMNTNPQTQGKMPWKATCY